MRKIKLAGIYKITHLPTGLYYIGMSVDIFNRWSSHYTNIKIGKHSSPEFVSAWNTTSYTQWQFTILEQVSLSEYKKESGLKGKALVSGFRHLLLRVERKWMSYHPVDFSLNKDKKHFAPKRV